MSSISSISRASDYVERVQAAVKSAEQVRAVGGGSKPALSADGTLSLEEVSGVLEYTPQEYTFTALAETKLSEVNALLAENGQYLPFDPPLAAAGTTLGGTVAAGLSGSGRFRYGGVRDFLLGVRFVSGEGQLVTGGGKVVKNAAGFDFPKLMVGSLGQFGVLVELTFKVFPVPESYATLNVDLPDFEKAVKAMHKLAVAPFELTCLDVIPPSRLALRVGGTAAALPKRLERLQAFIGQEGEVLTGEEDEQVWEEARAFTYLKSDQSLVKVPLNPNRVIELERALAGLESEVSRRYSVGGNVAWLGCPQGAEDELETSLSALNLSALALTGEWHTPLLGKQTGGEFMQRILSVLDPERKFALPANPTKNLTPARSVKGA